MKILYGIQGTGNGHLSRAEEIIPEFSKYADVDVIISGNQSQLKSSFEINYNKFLSEFPKDAELVQMLIFIRIVVHL